MEQDTGYVAGIAGGRGPKTGNRTLNRATSTKRSPGSTFKTLAVYLPALDSADMTLATIVDDAPYSYPNGKQVENVTPDNVAKNNVSVSIVSRKSVYDQFGH